VVVTGANSGLGFGTATQAALHGATVVMTCRSLAKCEEAKRKILADERFARRAAEVEKRLVPMEADLNSLKSVKAFAKAYRASGRPIHSLVLNAGIMAPPHELTADGIESQFGVNHVAHFALTKDLLDVVVRSQPSTVVAVSSLAHHFAPAFGFHHDLASLNDPNNYDAHAYYGQSKLANVLFAKELARRLKSEKVYVNAVHPGGVRGGLTRHIVSRGGSLSWLAERIDRAAQSLLYWDEETGALTTLAAAVDPDVAANDVRGKYFVPIGRISPNSRLGDDEKLARELWDFSEGILKAKGY